MTRLDRRRWPLLFTIGWMTAALARAGDQAAPDAPVPPDSRSPPSSERTVIQERWIGVLMTEALDGGVRLVAVVPAGPAARAGLRAGDVLVEWDGEPVPDRVTLRERIASSGSETREVVYVRRGAVQRVALRPEPRRPALWPQETASLPPFEVSAGVRVSDLTPELREHYGAPEDRGLLVVSLGVVGDSTEPGPLAVGDLLLEACGRPLRSARDWRLCLARARTEGELAVLRLRDDRTETLALNPGRAAGFRIGSILEDWVSEEAARERRRAELEGEIERLKARLADLEAAREALEEPDR